MSLRNRIAQAEEQRQMRAEYYRMEERVAELEDALREAATALSACDCFDDPTHSYCVRCRALALVGAALQEDRDGHTNTD